MKVKIKRVGKHELPLPKYETKGAAGMDLRADLSDHPAASPRPDSAYNGTERRCLEVLPGWSAAMPCGFAFSIPEGYEMQVRGRSGLAFRQNVNVHVGTIDHGYSGPVHIKLWNLGIEPLLIWDGDRVAQAIIAPVIQAELEEVDELDATERGANGFGHTGVR